MIAWYTCLTLFFLVLLSAATRAEDVRCAQLIALRDQYAGVKLTVSQQAFKRAATIWYHANCGMRRSRVGLAK